MKSKSFDEPSSLQVRTTLLLKNSPKSLLEIYQETGINFYWLKKFASGDIKNPSVNRVQNLYEFLTKTKLTLN